VEEVRTPVLQIFKRLEEEGVREEGGRGKGKRRGGRMVEIHHFCSLEESACAFCQYICLYPILSCLLTPLFLYRTLGLVMS